MEVGVIGKTTDLVQKLVDLDHEQEHVLAMIRLLPREGNHALDWALKPRLVTLKLVQVFMLILRF